MDRTRDALSVVETALGLLLEAVQADLDDAVAAANGQDTVLVDSLEAARDVVLAIDDHVTTLVVIVDDYRVTAPAR